MNPKTKGIFEAAFAKWGFESQVLVLSEEDSELSAACCRFLNHKTDSSKVAEEAADVEIMIEQLRHNGMGPMIDHEKNRKMARLAQVVGVESQPVSPFGPSVMGLLEEETEQDDTYVGFQLSAAAICYIEPMEAENYWPADWYDDSFKPTDTRRNLIKAAALIIAEIERLDRQLPEGGL